MWRSDKLQIMFIVMRYIKLYTLKHEWLLYNYSCVTNVKTKSRVTKRCRVYRMRPSHTRELLSLFGYVWFVFENRNGWLHKLCTSVTTSKTFEKNAIFVLDFRIINGIYVVTLALWCRWVQNLVFIFISP